MPRSSDRHRGNRPEPGTGERSSTPANLRAAVQAVLDEEMALRSVQLAPVGRDVRLVVDAIADLLQGGKRLRAAFCYWGYRAAGGTECEGIIRVAASMEMFQAAALVHDDVMDDSDTRRGAPAVHRRLESVHVDHTWHGSARRFGTAGAILAGDLCLVWTDTLFATSGLPRAELAAARPVFDEMRTQLMAGQFLDVLESVRTWDDLAAAERVERARHVIRYKSAKYSVEQPLLIGAAAAGAGRKDLRRLAAFGLAVGEAFQLRDDLLGVFGDPEMTGKPAGDDLREGKRTVLVAHALDELDAADRQRFLARLGDPDLSLDDVEWMRSRLVHTGAPDRVESDIAALLDDGLESLAACKGLEDAGLEALERLAVESTARQT